MKQDIALDAKNGNTLWADTISKEMENVRVAFKVLLDVRSVPIGHHFVQCHMVIDIEMEDFRCKARLVAGGSHDQGTGYYYLCQGSVKRDS